MDNGDGDNGDAILVPDSVPGSIMTGNMADFRRWRWRWRKGKLPGMPDQLLVTTVVGIPASVMENGEGSLPPASSCRAQSQCLCLLPRRDEGNGQWSQWKEPLNPKRYTVMCKGGSWL